MRKQHKDVAKLRSIPTQSCRCPVAETGEDEADTGVGDGMGFSHGGYNDGDTNTMMIMVGTKRVTPD